MAIGLYTYKIGRVALLYCVRRTVLARCGEVTLPNSRDINNNDNVSSLYNNQFTED
jgi:hypothetical protein